MNEEIIRLKTPVGNRDLKRDEIARIENFRNGDLMIHSYNKQLFIAGPTLWQGEDAKPMIELFNAQIAARAIPLENRNGIQ